MGAAALFTTEPVSAADMPVKARPLPPAVWTWTGCYIGGNVGYARANFRSSDAFVNFPAGPGPRFADFKSDDDGFIGGGQVGCNWQSGQWVWGIEGDIQWADIKGRRFFQDTFFGIVGAGAFSTEVRSQLDYLGTLRARAGFVVAPTTMLYLTGGLAYGRVKNELNFPPPGAATGGPGGTDSQTHVGWAIGVGGETRLTGNLTGKLEYLYADLGREQYSFLNVAAPNFNYFWKQRVDIHIVRVGLNYQFYRN